MPSHILAALHRAVHVSCVSERVRLRSWTSRKIGCWLALPLGLAAPHDPALISRGKRLLSRLVWQSVQLCCRACGEVTMFHFRGGAVDARQGAGHVGVLVDWNQHSSRPCVWADWSSWRR